jgi:hypothetical protein
VSLLGYLLAGALVVAVGFAIVSLMLTIVRAVEVVVAGTASLARLVGPPRRDERIP